MNTQSFPFPLKVFVKQIAETKPSRDDETAVFMTSAEDMVPATLVRLVERTHVLPRRLVLFTMHTMRVPIVEDNDAIEIREYPEGCYGVTAKLGFMEPPRMPHFLELCVARAWISISTRYFSTCRALPLKRRAKPSWPRGERFCLL